MHVGHIIRGWGMRFGLIPTSDAEKKLADLRLKICAGCKYAQKRKILRIVNGEVNNNAELQCTLCHCPCLEKALVTDEVCPVKKW